MLNHKSSLLVIMVVVGLGLSTAVRAQSTPGLGDLVINEIMYNPDGAEPGEEWFEVRNTTGVNLDIGNCVISSLNDTDHTISPGTSIPPHSYFVFGRSSSIPGVSVDYAYGTSGSIRLNNSNDSITITCGSTVIDTVTYGTSSPWPSNVNGTSIAFGLPSGGSTPYSENDNGANWGHSTSTCCGGSGKGTPGARNDDILGPTAITLSTFVAHSTPEAHAVVDIPAAVLHQWWLLLGTIAASTIEILRRRGR